MTDARRAELAAKEGTTPTRRPDDFVTVAWLTMRWDVNKKTIYKFIECGLLEAIELPGVGFRVRYESVLAFEAKHYRRATA